MSIRSILRRIKKSRGFSRLRETTRLKRIAPLVCDPGNLGRLAAEELHEMFTNRQLADEWLDVEKTLDESGGPQPASGVKAGGVKAGGVKAGGVNSGDQRAIYCLVRALRPRSILEIGTHVGSSTLGMALAAKRLAAAPEPVETTITTVDVHDVNHPVTGAWVKLGAEHSPAEMIDRIGASRFVSFRRRDSLEFLRDETDAGRFDFIFLDGDHSAPAVYQEIPAALRRLNRPGFILLHDYFPTLRPLWSDGIVLYGPRLAVQKLQREGAAIRVLPLGELPWRTKLDCNVTSLALVGS